MVRSNSWIMVTICIYEACWKHSFMYVGVLFYLF